MYQNIILVYNTKFTMLILDNNNKKIYYYNRVQLFWYNVEVSKERYLRDLKQLIGIKELINDKYYIFTKICFIFTYLIFS